MGNGVHYRSSVKNGELGVDMATEHERVSSEEDEDEESGMRAPQPAGTRPSDAADSHGTVSSEDGDGEGGDDEASDLAEDGREIETHGGGTLEFVPGFSDASALTEGFPSEYAEVDPELEALPRSCDLEFETPESVCGRDDRVRIRSTTRIPWRLICQLIITRRDGAKSRCTGWFIGPRTVMTAGHCLYSHSAGGWARQIEVIPGMDASSRPYGSQIGRSFRSVRGWTRDRKPAFDYGAIILPNNTLGNRVGWFGFAALSDGSLRNLLVNNAGYAGDKPFGTLWYNAGRITKVTARRLYYMIDTAGGHSGSPVWRYRNGKRHAVGVHAYGGCPNKSLRITRAVYNNMKAWKNLGF
jgi:glutamyl endopeptidase